MVNNEKHFNETASGIQKDLIDPMQKENDNKKVASTQTRDKPSLTGLMETPLNTIT